MFHVKPNIHNLMPGASLLLVFNTFFKTLGPHQHHEEFWSHDQPYLQEPAKQIHPFFMYLLCKKTPTFWRLYSVKMKEKQLEFHSLIPLCGGGHLLSFM